MSDTKLPSKTGAIIWVSQLSSPWSGSVQDFSTAPVKMMLSEIGADFWEPRDGLEELVWLSEFDIKDYGHQFEDAQIMEWSDALEPETYGSMSASIGRVRHLHKKVDGRKPWKLDSYACSHCRSGEWPCPTIQALGDD